MIFLTLLTLVFKIMVAPLAYMPGATIRVTCIVPREASNRQLDAVLDEYTSSTRQLDGESAPAVFIFTFPHAPCVSRAACVVTDNHQKQRAVYAQLVCQEP